LRQINSLGPEAWSQTANGKTQDKASPEAKAGFFGRLFAPGGNEGFEGIGEAGARGIQQAPALCHAR
jgi:hypothetical protein